jgi:hypothetical protein
MVGSTPKTVTSGSQMYGYLTNVIEHGFSGPDQKGVVDEGRRTRGVGILLTSTTIEASDPLLLDLARSRSRVLGQLVRTLEKSVGLKIQLHGSPIV